MRNTSDKGGPYQWWLMWLFIGVLVGVGFERYKNSVYIFVHRGDVISGIDQFGNLTRAVADSVIKNGKGEVLVQAGYYRISSPDMYIRNVDGSWSADSNYVKEEFKQWTSDCKDLGSLTTDPLPDDPFKKD